jgi:hypothetical protein
VRRSSGMPQQRSRRIAILKVGHYRAASGNALSLRSIVISGHLFTTSFT